MTQYNLICVSESGFLPDAIEAAGRADIWGGWAAASTPAHRAAGVIGITTGVRANLGILPEKPHISLGTLLCEETGEPSLQDDCNWSRKPCNRVHREDDDEEKGDQCLCSYTGGILP